MTLQICLEPYKYLLPPQKSCTAVSKSYINYIYFNEKLEKIALFMQLNYQAMTLKLGHYTIANQGKGSATLVQTIILLFSMFGVHGFALSKKKKKEKKNVKN